MRVILLSELLAAATGSDLSLNECVSRVNCDESLN